MQVNRYFEKKIIKNLTLQIVFYLISHKQKNCDLKTFLCMISVP